MKPRLIIGIYILLVVFAVLAIFLSNSRAVESANSIGSEDDQSGKIQNESIISASFSRNLLG